MVSLFHGFIVRKQWNNVSMKQSKQGFTLIELLVVIAIIGSLSVLFVPNFMAAREKARDTQRKSDLKQIQKAFELYKQDQSPVTLPNGLPATGSCFSSSAGCTGNIYMTHFPGDPLPSFHYTYIFDNTNLTYTLCACLENKADPDGVNAPCTGFACSSGKSYVVNQP